MYYVNNMGVSPINYMSCVKYEETVLVLLVWLFLSSLSVPPNPKK